METEYEFIEPHAVCGSGGQQWPIEHDDRDQEIADHIFLVSEQVGGYGK